jgi:hypothetical protein
MNIYRNAIARLLTISEEGYLPIFKEESNKDNTMSKIKIADLIGPNNLDLLKEENARVGTANEASANTYISIIDIDSDLALANGISYWLKYNSTNTSTITLNINGLGAKSVLKYGNVPLTASDLVMGHYYEHIYNGTAFEITLETNKVVKEYLTASGTDTYTSNLELDYGIYVNAMYPVKFTNANTGAATLNLNGLGAKNIYTSSGAALSSGDILANSTRILIYNGSDFILFGNASISVTPAALTKVDDTNVTLTLGGTPSTALLQAVSLTLGWTGQLAASKGGLGIDTSASSGYGKVTAGTWSVISASTLKSDLSLNLVENTALSTWAGTTNITTLGTIATGVWNGTAIGDSYISSAATWNAKLTSALTSAYFFVGNVSNVATGVAMSGDATLANTGAVTLASTAVTPGTYGDASNIPYFIVDAKGRITSAGSNALAAGNIYTQDGTSTDNARLIKTKTNDNASYYSFQTLAGVNIVKFKGNNSIDFGAIGVEQEVNHYGGNGATEKFYTFSGNKYMEYNSQFGYLNMYATANGALVMVCNNQAYSGSIYLSGLQPTFSFTGNNGASFYGYADNFVSKTTWKGNPAGVGVEITGYAATGYIALGAASTGVYNLEITGTSWFKGLGSTSATYNTKWVNASNVQAMSIRDDGHIDFGVSGGTQQVKFYCRDGESTRFYRFSGGTEFANFNGNGYFSILDPSGNNRITMYGHNTYGGRLTLSGGESAFIVNNGVGAAASTYAYGGACYTYYTNNAGVVKASIWSQGYMSVGADTSFTYNFEVTGTSWFNGAVHNVKGANIASAADLTLTTNSHTITGTTTINALTILPFVAGDHITLVFTGATTVKHNTAGGVGTAVFKLAGSVDFVTAADTVLGLYYDGTVFQQTFEKHA